jgi:hypothetical protein
MLIKKQNYQQILSFIKSGFFILLLSSLAVACDKVEKNDDGNYRTKEELPLIRRKVLLEEYTAMKCIYCPDAAKIAESLKQTYGDNLVWVGLHGGQLAAPSGIFTKDFRTDAVNYYANYFGVSEIPTGLVNRNSTYDNYLLEASEWGAAVIRQAADTSYWEINISNDWKEADRKVSAQITLSASEIPSDAFSLQLWLVEDNIVSPQAGINGLIINDYVHRYVFRKALNGTWGEQLENLKKNETFTTSVSFSLPEDYVVSNCSVVAFVFRGSDGFVLGVNQKKIIK